MDEKPPTTRLPVASVGRLFVVPAPAELAEHVPPADANDRWAARLVDARFGYVVGALGVRYGAVGLRGIARLAPLTATVLGRDAEGGGLLAFLAVLARVVAHLLDVVRVRGRLDPERRFGHAYLERVLG